MSDLTKRIVIAKRAYKKALQELQASVGSEFDHLDDDIFEPSPGIDSAAFKCHRNIHG